MTTVKILLHKLWSNKLATIGALVVLTMFLISFLAPQISNFDPYQIDPALRLEPPGTAGHIL
ncbi:MAG: ABC transporter permease, partial [Deltaproteobacteria bacterium]|nr:ABC transporter permease [Deltaproteobacteria bacterium]